MSTGPAIEGAGPVPPGRAHILSRLETERRQAEGCGAWERERELAAQIRQLSAGDAQNPARETTGRPRAARKQANG
jgi:hypothetical protein